MTDLSNPVRFSHLKNMARSPAHYRASVLTPWRDSPAMRMGRLVHQLVLEPERQPVVYPGQRRGKAWESFRDAHDGADIFTTAELEQAMGVAGQVESSPDAMAVLEGEREQRMRWEIRGRACHGTPDVLNSHVRRVTDLKVTANADPDKFVWHALRMGWLAQLPWYANGADMPDAELCIVAVEPTGMVPPVVLRLDPSARDLGNQQWRGWFERLLVCEESGQWPGYTQGILDISAPGDADLIFDEDAA